MARHHGKSSLTFTDSVKGGTSQPVAHVDDLLGFGGSGQDVLPFGCDLGHTQYVSETERSEKMALTLSTQRLKTGNRAFVSATPKAGWTTFL